MEVGQLWVKLGLDKSNFDSGINETKGKATGLSGVIKNALSFTLGQGMFDLIKTGIKSAWDTSIGFNSQIQQSQAAFTTLLGNASKASTMLGSLSKMAADTPFELTDLNKASQVLLGFGIDAKNIMPDLKMLGDVSMGNKEKLQGLALVFAQVQSQGKMMGQDLLQMINNGFNPLQEISKQTGKSMSVLKDEMAKGKISADMVANAFKGATEKGGLFYGSMDKQSKTFEGQMSTLSDNVKSTLGGVLRTQFDYLSNTIMPTAIDKVNKFGDAFKAGGLSAAMKTILPAGLVDGLTSVGNAIEKAFGWLNEHGEAVKTVIAGITAGFVAYKLAVMASIVQQEISNTITAITTIAKGKEAIQTALATGAKGNDTIAQWLLNAAMNANPLMIIIILIAALVGAFIYLWNTNEGFRKAVIEAWNTIKTTAINVFNGIKNFFEDVWNGIKTGATNAWNGIKNTIISVWDGIKKFFKDFWDTEIRGWKNIFNGIKDNMLGWGKDMIDGLINGIKSKISGVVDAVKGIGDKIRSFLHFSVPDEGPLKDYESWMPDFISGMANGVDSNKNTLVDKIKNLASNMALNVKGNLSNTAMSGVSGGQTIINFNGNYGFNNKEDIDYFMNQAAIKINRRK